jgi:hypothetical protein
MGNIFKKKTCKHTLKDGSRCKNYSDKRGMCEYHYKILKLEKKYHDNMLTSQQYKVELKNLYEEYKEKVTLKMKENWKEFLYWRGVMEIRSYSEYGVNKLNKLQKQCVYFSDAKDQLLKENGETKPPEPALTEYRIKRKEGMIVDVINKTTGKSEWWD